MGGVPPVCYESRDHSSLSPTARRTGAVHFRGYAALGAGPRGGARCRRPPEQAHLVRFQRPRGAPLRGPQKEHLHFGIRLELPPAPITRRVMSPQTWKVRSVAHPATGALLTSRQQTARWSKRIYTVRIARFSTYPEEVWSGIAAPQPSASSRKANDQFRAAMSWAQLRKAAP